MIVKRLVFAALFLAGAIPCLLLVVFFVGPQDRAYCHQQVLLESQFQTLEAGREMDLEPGPAFPWNGGLELTAFCRGPCGGLRLRLPGGAGDVSPASREEQRLYFMIPPGSHGRALLHNPTPRPVVVSGYRFKNYLVNNSNFPRFLLLLPSRHGLEPGLGGRLIWLLLALALQLGGLWVAAGLGRTGRRTLPRCLVLAPPWLALAAGLWLAGSGLRLVLASETLLILAGAGGLSAAGIRWGPPAWRRLAAWVQGPLRGLLTQPDGEAAGRFTQRWAAPFLYLTMGLYLAYAAIFSLRPGWQAQEWVVGKYTWLVMVALLAALLAAWRLGWLGWLGRLGPYLPGWAVFLLALLPRLSWALFSGVKQESDYAHFARMAREIYEGSYLLLPYKGLGLEAMHKGIYWLVGTGPSIVSAGAYCVAGPYQEAALAPVALASALEVYLVYRIALRLWDRDTAALAALFLALCPTHVLFCNLMGSDVYFSCLITLAFFLFSKFRDRLGDLFWAVLSGLSLGAAQWMRPTMPLFLVSLLTTMALGWWRRPAKLACLAGCLLLGTALLVVPILEHNLEELGIVSISPSQMGNWSLLVGANLKSRGWFTLNDVHMLQEEVARRTVPPNVNPLIFAEEVSRELTWKRIMADPMGYLWLAVVHKPLSLWARATHLRHSLVTSVLRQWRKDIEAVASYYYKLLMAVAIGALLWGGLRRRLPAGVLFSLTLAALLTSASHAVLEVQPRYHFMFLPWLAMLAASWASLSRRV